MAKNKISEYSSTAANNTDIAGINIAEGCAPSGINNAIRELMAQLKDQQAGTDGDNFAVGGNLSVTGTTNLTGAITCGGAVVFSSGTTFSSATTFSSPVVMSSTVTMSGNNNIGATTSSTILSGSVTQTSSSVLYLDDAATTSSAPPLSWDGDTNTGIYRPAADTLAIVTGGTDRLRVNSSGVVIIGSGEATTTVSGKVLRAPDASGTNIAGANFEINAGNGTGTGGSGNIILKTADVGVTGSSANTMTQRLLITPKGGISFGSGATNYGTTGQVLKSNGDAPPSFGSVITSGTTVTVSGTNIDFTSIPSTAKRITIMFSGVSQNSASQLIIVQIGAGSIVTSGYTSGVAYCGGTSSAGGANPTNGFGVANASNAADILSGTITLSNFGSNTWVSSGTLAITNSAYAYTCGGNITLGGILDRVRITTSAGSATFDAGSINILYE